MKCAHRINWGSFKSKVWEGGAEDVGIPSVEPIAPSSNAKVTSEIHVSFKSYEVNVKAFM